MQELACGGVQNTTYLTKIKNKNKKMATRQRSVFARLCARKNKCTYGHFTFRTEINKAKTTPIKKQ